MLTLIRYSARTITHKLRHIPPQLKIHLASLAKQPKQPSNHTTRFPNQTLKDIHQHNLHQHQQYLDAGKTQQEILQLYQPNHHEESRLIEAQQDLIIESIKSASPLKQLPTKSPPTHSQHKLHSHIPNTKINATQQDFLEAKYSPELIAKARNYQNHQISYFKKLIQYPIASKQGMHQRDSKQPIEKESTKMVKQQQAQKHNPTQEKGVKKLEDVNHLRQRAINQFTERERLTATDRTILKEGDQDLKLIKQQSNIFLTEALHLPSNKQANLTYLESSFAKQEQRISKLALKLNQIGVDVDIETLKSIDKSVLFHQKKFREDQQEFQKHLHRRQKKKQMKKYLQKIHQQPLNEDINYDIPSQPGFKAKANKNQTLQQMKNQLNEMEQKKQSSLASQKDSKKIHSIKTFKKMQFFLNTYFYHESFNANQTHTYKIQICEVIPNQSLTVLNLFWNFKERLDEENDETTKQINQLQRALDKKSNYISGLMTQYMGLRYGPSIRFYYDQKLQKTIEIKKDLQKCKKEVIESEIESYKVKGLIKNKNDEKQYREKIKGLAQYNLDDFNSRNIILSKSYREKINKQQKNKISKQAVKAEKKKKQPTSKFWDQINKL